MADDVKLQLGIDVEALQRSASQATNVISQAFEKGISANLLGNGLVPTQGPSNQSQNNSIAGVITAIQQVNRTLVVGFNSLAGGVYLGGGGGGGVGGGAPGGGGGAGAAGLVPPAAGAGVAGGGFGVAAQILSRAGDLTAALMPSTMKLGMGWSPTHGFSSTDAVGLLHNFVSQIPYAGKFLGAVTNPFYQVMQQNQGFSNMQYELFRDVGEDAMNAFTTMWSDPKRQRQYVDRYGFSRSETQQLMQAGLRQGIHLDPGTLGLGEGQNLSTILNMQGALGLGMESAQTMGGLLRGGLKSGRETDVLASAIGVAVATGLERGRWGEMLTMWQRAAASSVDTDIAWKEVAAQQQFVGSLGGRFQGDTPASRSMFQALQQMTSDTQSPLALRAAMQLTGGDYFSATTRMARSAEQPDTEMQEAIVNQVVGTSAAQTYLAMPETTDADRARAAKALEHASGIASLLGIRGMSQLKLAELLKARKKTTGAMFKTVSDETMSVGRRQFIGAALPGVALDPRIHEANAQIPSRLSEIQRIGSLSDDSPQEQLWRARQSALPTAEDLRRGNWTIDPSSLGPDSAAGAGSISGLGDLSAADIRAAAELAGVPVETMRSWFQIESGGRLSTIDAGGSVRGFAQMNREEAASVGVSPGDFGRLSTDKAFSLQKSAELASRYLRLARSQAPAGWSERDILHLMKLEHGGVGTAKFVMQQFQQKMGRSPTSWDDLYNVESGLLPGGSGVGQLGALMNANKIVVEVVVRDQTGRVVGSSVRSPTGAKIITSSPGQLVGGHR